MATAQQRTKSLKQRHPLQRLESPGKGFSGVLHIVGLYDFYLGFRFLISNPNFINESFGWHLQYLTILGLSLSTACFLCGLLADITSSNALFRTKNYLALIAAPLEILISILYWLLRAIDPQLVIPENLPAPPFVIDLCFHLFPSVVLLIDALLLSPPWPTSPMNRNAPLVTLSASTAIAVLYWFWLELCYSKNGFYPYPIMELLTKSQRVGLFVTSGVVMWVVGAGLRAGYAWVNGLEGDSEDAKVQAISKFQELTSGSGTDESEHRKRK